MDKLKPILKIIKKYHVWVLCLVVIGTAVGGLFAGSAGLQKDAKTTEGKIKALDSKIDKIARTSKPPNQVWIDAKKQETEEERVRIRQMWEKIYDQQQAGLIWPESAGGLAFANKIEEQAGQSRLHKVQEQQFEKYAAGAFDALLEIVKAQKNIPQVSDEKTDAPGKTKLPKNTISLPLVRAGYVVGWSPESQQRISHRLVRWGDERKFFAPTTARAKKTQRDLWIYGSMLDAIAATNTGATANYIAKVKYILDLQIGKDVVPLVQKVIAPKTNTKTKAGAKQPKTTPRAASPPRSKTSELAESIPVRMDLIVDQRYLSLLLAECANTKIPIEVTGFTARYRSRSGKDHFDQRTADENGAAAKGNSAVGTVVDTFDMRVSIEGKVHFYKQVNTQVLGNQ
jgi:hypothetical protein